MAVAAASCGGRHDSNAEEGKREAPHDISVSTASPPGSNAPFAVAEQHPGAETAHILGVRPPFFGAHHVGVLDRTDGMARGNINDSELLIAA